MKKTTFKVILRMPNYYNEGFLQINGDNVIARLTDDTANGCFKGGRLSFNLIKQKYDEFFLFPYTERESFIIKIPELYSPMEYEFQNKKKENCSLEFVSVDNSYDFESEGYS